MARTESLSCSVCLDLLTNPVTIPCGHNYCIGCVRSHWDREEEKKHYSCPDCRKTFKSRPVLVTNTRMAALVEEMRKTKLTDGVLCDVCNETKEKAVKSCLRCLASYCETHLQQHYQAAPLQKHKLIEPTADLTDNMCSVHDEPVKLFCRTDRQCICYLCSVDQHSGHEVVSAAAERAQGQRELEDRRDKLQQTIQDKEKDLEEVKQEVEAVGRSAAKAVQRSEDKFTQLIQLLEKRRLEVEKQIRAQLETEICRMKKTEEKLEREITELTQTVAELGALSRLQDPRQFLHKLPSLLKSSEAPDSTRTQTHTSACFEDITAVFSALTDQIQLVLSQDTAGALAALRQVKDNVKCFRQITLEPDTANSGLSLSDGGRRATVESQPQTYPDHPDRFSFWTQVLSKESLSGRCYFEVEWSGGTVGVALAYKKIKKKGSTKDCRFGFNDNSWVLECNSKGYSFGFSDVWCQVSGPCSCRVGVYVDCRLGELAFYSVSQTLTLLHRVKATFTEPLHVGLYFDWLSAGAHFP